MLEAADGILVFFFCAIAIYGVFGREQLRAFQYPKWFNILTVLFSPFYAYYAYLAFTSNVEIIHGVIFPLILHTLLVFQVGLIVWLRRAAYLKSINP